MKHAALGILVVFSSLLASGSALAAPEDGWLRDACPDGRMVRVTNPSTGATADVPCEDIRAGLASMPKIMDAVMSEQGEVLVESREPLFLSLICAVAASVAGIYTVRGVCPADDPHCGEGVGGGFIGLGLLCGLLP